MIKIFIDYKIIFLYNASEYINELHKEPVLDFKNPASFLRNIEAFGHNKEKNIFFKHTLVDEMLTAFLSIYHLIEAAGGLVKNKEGKTLMIFRNGKWDLPKGKIEKGESIKDGALREIEEECGITQLKIAKQIHTTYHCYDLKGKKILKKSYWFEVFCGAGDNLFPQQEEGITEVKWMDKSEVQEALKNSYNSIIDVIKQDS